MRAGILCVVERIIHTSVLRHVDLQPACYNDIAYFEAKTGMKSPHEMPTCYTLYRGLYAREDHCSIIRLMGIVHDKRYTDNGFQLAEYRSFLLILCIEGCMHAKIIVA
ncbi:hypothetical protein [Chitinophaga sp.]|uniref:hypothetical protein n=1 Tax=Chitinophaga sp. TaxID=1869181 RepID=UPI0031CE7AD2